MIVVMAAVAAVSVVMMMVMVVTTGTVIMVRIMTMLMLMMTAMAVVIMFMSVVAAVVVLMMLVVVLMGLCGKFFFLHWLPLHFFHDVIEGHSKYLPDMGIVQGVIDDSPLFTAFHNAGNFQYPQLMADGALCHA